MRVFADKLHNNGVNKNGRKHPPMIIIVDQSATSSIDKTKQQIEELKNGFIFFVLFLYRSISMGIAV